MSVEYSLISQKRENDIKKIEKLCGKISSDIDKTLTPFIDDKDNSEMASLCLDANKALLVAVKKAFSSLPKSEDVEICTVAKNHVYYEMSMDVLKDKMDKCPGDLVVVGDDGSKYKTFAQFSKIIEQAEKK